MAHLIFHLAFDDVNVPNQRYTGCTRKNLIEGFPCGTNIQYVSRSHADVAFRKVISTSGNLKGKIVGSPFFLI